MITKRKITTVQDKIKRALAQIEQEEKVKISFGTRSYNDSEYSTKMVVKTIAKDVKTVKAVDGVQTQMSMNYGFSENIIGKTFRTMNGTHTIKEFKTRNRKYPIITTCSNGGSYKFAPSQIKSYSIR